jgi:hypothetical protein
MMTSQKEFGTDKLTGRFFDFFMSQLDLLEKLYKHQFTKLKHLDDARVGKLYPLLFSIHHTGISISLLSSHLHTNECYILARSFLERLIIYIFLLSCDESEYSRYLAYTKQKGYRVLNRSFVVGDSEVRLKWSGIIDLEKEPDLKQAVDTFTSETGKPKTKWTSKRLSEMVQSIASRGKLEIGYLMFAKLWIYEDASEALHGTLYGSTFHVGTSIGKIPSSKEELKKTWNEQFSALFLTLGTCMHTLMQAFHKVANVDDIISNSKNNLTTIRSAMKEMWNTQA